MKKLYSILALAILLTIAIYQQTKEQYFREISHVKQIPKANYRVLILWTKGIGEREWVKRIQNSCNNLNWECYVASTYLNFLEKLVLKNPIEKVVQTIKPDFIVTIEGLSCFSHLAPHYLCLSGGVNKYLQGHGKFHPDNLKGFDGYLMAFSDIDSFQTKMQPFKKNFHGMNWFPTCEKRSYQSIEPKSIFYCGSNWDARRGSDEYKKFFSLLDQSGDLNVYGSKKKWSYLKSSYKGTIPFDGKSMIEKMQRSGIALLLHADSHLEGDAPSSRIFEAASAGCVIISDRHPFIEREFKDCVLFIDQQKSAIEMYEQIKAHMQWIGSHTEKAKEMALRAHQVFLERFSLEDHLQSLARFHEEIKRGKFQNAVLSDTTSLD